MIKITQIAEEKIKELKEFLKTTKRPDECDRARAILKLIEGKKRQEVASFFDIHVKTLDEWQRQFKRQGIEGLRTAPQVGNNKKLSRDQKEAIKATLTTKTPEELGLEGKFWSVPSLKQYVKQEYHVVYQSAVSYQRLFQCCGFSYHKGKKVNKKQNPHMRKRFEDTLKKSSKGISGEKMVWYW